MIGFAEWWPLLIPAVVVVVAVGYALWGLGFGWPHKP